MILQNQNQNAAIAAILDLRGPTIVAVDGHSASGKTTFARTLAGAGPSTILHLDDFYRPMPSEERAALTPEGQRNSSMLAVSPRKRWLPCELAATHTSKRMTGRATGLASGERPQ